MRYKYITATLDSKLQNQLHNPLEFVLENYLSSKKSLQHSSNPYERNFQKAINRHSLNLPRILASSLLIRLVSAYIGVWLKKERKKDKKKKPLLICSFECPKWTLPNHAFHLWPLLALPCWAWNNFQRLLHAIIHQNIFSSRMSSNQGWAFCDFWKTHFPITSKILIILIKHIVSKNSSNSKL